MHKYFAKTLFLGKKISFLPECHSTNDELMDSVKRKHAQDGDVLYTNYQKKGKGQRGNAWLSEPGKNLLFSFVISADFLQPKQCHFLNIITGLAVLKTLKACLPASRRLELKWPNDLYVADKKVSGVLIETIIEQNILQHAVIGVGVNVNQRDFYLNTATSLYQETGRDFDREDLLEQFLVTFEGYYLRIKSDGASAILKEYYEVMRWKGEIHHYRSDGREFSGEILGIDDYGRLVVSINQSTRHFDVKEIEFLY